MKFKFLSVLVASSTLISASLLPANALEQEAQPVVNNNQLSQTSQSAQELKAKLALFEGFSADFTQKVVDTDEQLLQQSQGRLTVKRPNFVHWQTLAPDENLVVSDGATLWFYNPFVEQVSAFTLDNSITNTPVLLLTDLESEAWQSFDVIKTSAEHFVIHATDVAAQVKQLELTFADNRLTEFVILDATGQKSQFMLSNVKNTGLPDSSFFTFTVPAGVDFDDQR
jgi:outer membrane lipoprotein carrier protein